jgi:sugar phosphate isomerase/epimerase
MELAISTLFCLNKEFDEAPSEITDIGSRCIEIVDAGPHTLSKARVKKLLEFKDSYDIKYSVHAPFTDVNISADDHFIRKSILKRLKRSIVWASRLGEILVFHPGNSTAVKRFSTKSAWNINLESVRSLFRFAEDLGVRAMIENVPEPFSYVMKSVDDFSRFYNEIGMKIEMVIDVAHANLRGEAIEFIKTFSNRIGHVHVSDNRGKSDIHLRLGEGSIDWRHVIESLKKIRYDGWVTIESYEGIIESLNFLRSII